MADTKWSQFPSATPGNSDEVVGLHSGDNARFSIANIVAAVRNGLANIFVPLTRTINSKALSTDISLDASDVGAVDTADVGAVNGVASLDSTGKVPSAQLPSIPSDASDIDYDNTQSGLTATDVQEAIDELAQGGGGTTVIANPSGAATDTLTKLQVENTIYSVSGGGSGASEAQLAYVNTGTIATQNYSAGAYICWNGLLYTAKQAISSGTTLSAATGGNLTECVGGGFNSLFNALEKGQFYTVSVDTHGKTQNTAYRISLPNGWLTSNTSIAWVNYRVWGNSYPILSIAFDSNIQTNVLLVSTNEIQYTCIGYLSMQGELEIVLFHKA